MRLNAKDIYDKSFHRTFKGYDEKEVDEFLDVVIKDFVDMEEELKTLREQNEQMQEQLSTVDTLREELESQKQALELQYAEKFEAVEADKRSRDDLVTQTLIAAQKTADILLSEAKSQAAEIVQTAEDRAARIDGIYYVQLAKQKRNINLIRQLVEQCKSDYESLLAHNQELFSQKSDEILSSIVNFDANELDVEAQGYVDAGVKASELSELDKRLNEKPISNADFYEEVAMEQPVAEPKKYQSNYSDYSWLYDESAEQTIEVNLPKKSPEEEQKLKQLIDDITE